MSAGTGMGINVGLVSTDAQAPLGFIHNEPASLNQGLLTQGEKTWIYVKAGAALAVGTVCVRAPGANNGNYGNTLVGADATGVVLAAAGDALGRIVGVAQHALADGEFGFIQRSGIGNAIDGGIAADTGIIPGAAAGQVQTVAAALPSFGVGLTVAVAPSVVGSCMFDCEG